MHRRLRYGRLEKYTLQNQSLKAVVKEVEAGLKYAQKALVRPIGKIHFGKIKV